MNADASADRSPEPFGPLVFPHVEGVQSRSYFTIQILNGICICILGIFKEGFLLLEYIESGFSLNGERETLKIIYPFFLTRFSAFFNFN